MSNMLNNFTLLITSTFTALPIKEALNFLFIGL